MQRKYIFLGSLIVVINLLVNSNCFSQAKEEEEEKAQAMRQLLSEKPRPYRLTTDAGIFSGYDSNVNLSPTSKGDMFEEFLFSLNFSKRWKNGLRFNFDYDLNDLSYNEITDASNLLNHLRFGIDKEISAFNIGIGYDFSYFYYPFNAEGTFFIHKGFFYIKNNLSRSLYHQLLFEAGAKRHTERKALSDAIGTFQDKELTNDRHSAEYSVGAALSPKLSLKFRVKFLINDSNARYLDFYDYKSYEVSPSVNYKLTKRLELHSNFSYLRKSYESRQVTLTTYKQRDQIYSLGIGMTYKLHKNNTLSLFYAYRDNSTPESLEKYNDHVITCGWQHNF